MIRRKRVGNPEQDLARATKLSRQPDSRLYYQAASAPRQAGDPLRSSRTNQTHSEANSGRTFQPTSLSNTITFDRYAFIMGRCASP